MSAAPKVFISATSGDLRGVRQVVKEALLTIGCHPVEQTNFGPDWRTVEGMLEAKIGDCQALIHIAGMRYGAEPDPASLPPDATRRSYTQMEHAIGRRLHAERGDDGFRVYAFVCPEDFPYDVPLDSDGQPAAPEPEEKARLQREHRAALLGGEALYRTPRDTAQLAASILALREEVLALRREQAAVREEVRGARKSILGVLALVIVLLAGIGGGLWWMKRDTGKVIAGQKEIAEGQKLIIEGPKITTAGIRKQILLGSEKKRDRDLAEAGSAEPIEREKLREAALKAHELRISRIDELAASFTELEGRADATAVFREMTRILEQEGVEMALSYVAEQKGGILDRIRKRKETERQQTRTELQPLLSAAGLQASAGQTVAARVSYKQLQGLDPDWPEALSDCLKNAAFQ